MNETVIEGWGTAAEVVNRLAGSWSLSRIITGQATMQGAAVVTPSEDGMFAYREQGHLTLANGTTLEAEREYIFRQGERGFLVFFKKAPPQLFHEISLFASAEGALSGSAGHLCNLDHYQSTYTFLADGRFIVRHAVSGPRKDYTMVTAYTRK
ncbi:DUF6314 family protein [Bradyrhizobium sp. CCBAU 51627]|uniref:DUF6314 family protein n=1 Tax=Bradyrhizobium sp. CCBAU 51627 TaxID=1325088 RepID=UPI0023051D78|nr:DUF6314 family protein [Bradyrhizobium sp. CCBAU 51627]MDA9436803.1 hypothetical protein [Bradyrhizobium sp. CCBAU 51627]